MIHNLNILSATAAFLLFPSIFAAPTPILSARTSVSSKTPRPPGGNLHPATSPQKRQYTNQDAEYTGYIKVLDYYGQSLGYLNGIPSDNGIFSTNFTDCIDEALLISINADFNGTFPTDETNTTLVVESPITDFTQDFPFVAAVQGYYNTGDLDLDPSNANYAYLSLSAFTTPSGPSVVGDNLVNQVFDTSLPQETSIWFYNSEFSSIVPLWRGQDGSQTSLSVIGVDGEILLTGNATATIDVWGGELYSLYFEACDGGHSR